MIRHRTIEVPKEVLGKVAGCHAAGRVVASGDALAKVLSAHWKLQVGLVASGTHGLMECLACMPVGEVILPAFCCGELAAAVRLMGRTVRWAPVTTQGLLDWDSLVLGEGVAGIVSVAAFGQEDARMRDWIRRHPTRPMIVEDWSHLTHPPVQGLVGDVAFGSLYVTKPLGGVTGGWVSLSPRAPAVPSVLHAALVAHRLATCEAQIARWRTQFLRYDRAFADVERRWVEAALGQSSGGVWVGCIRSLAQPFRYLLVVQDGREARRLIGRFEKHGIEARLMWAESLVTWKAVSLPMEGVTDEQLSWWKRDLAALAVQEGRADAGDVVSG